MKKSTIAVVIIVIVALAAVFWLRKSPSSIFPSSNNGNASTTAPVSVVETTKVSSKTSKYENAELGFSVNYPSNWEADNTNTGVAFVMPIDPGQVSTLAKLTADINILASKCAFPPVTTIKERGTITVGKSTLNMITMSNTVQGRGYYNRMYSLQNGAICYLFTFSSITQSPESKKLTGSNVTQAQNNNKAIINTADTDFTNMVKSFTLVEGPAGQDETKISPVKK